MTENQDPVHPTNRRLKWWLTIPLVIFASLLMWCEETLWIWLKRLTSIVARFNVVRHFEEFIVQLPPYVMMVVFLLPMSVLFPFKLLAVYWLSQGQWLASLITILAAKVFGTAIVARMYVVCKPKLMTIAWFKTLHDWLIDTRNRLYGAVRSLPFYQAARVFLLTIKQKLIKLRKRLKFRARWRLLRRWVRRS